MLNFVKTHPIFNTVACKGHFMKSIPVCALLYQIQTDFYKRLFCIEKKDSKTAHREKKSSQIGIQK